MDRSCLRHLSLVSLVLLLAAGSASAQTTRTEWLALRGAKEGRQGLVPANPRRSVLTVSSVTIASDAAGNTIALGRATNASPADLAYARVLLTFRNAGGAALGSEWAYVTGGATARILPSNEYDAVLGPQVGGFFKVWTTIPRSAVASYDVQTVGEEVSYARPLASVGSSNSRASDWTPLVSVQGTPLVSGARVTGTVINDDPITPMCPCGHPSILAYNLRVWVATYQNGALTDLRSTTAVGPRAGDQCSAQPTTGIVLHDSAAFALDLAVPADQAVASVEWEEKDLSSRAVTMPVGGGSVTLTAAHKCPLPIQATDSWISIDERPLPGQPAGNVTISVPPNTGIARVGAVEINDLRVSVLQEGCYVRPGTSVVYLGSGSVQYLPLDVAANCRWSLTSNASWLSPLAGIYPGGR